MRFEPNCPCKGTNLDKLIQPIILTILLEGEESGYSILQKIADSPMMNGIKPDATGVYRYLKSMEKKGILTSREPESGKGNAKKYYSVSEHGKQCLFNWVCTLKDYRDSIDLLLVEIQKFVKIYL